MAVLSAFGTLAACFADADADFPLPLVAVEPVQAIDFSERVTATGGLLATNHADIAARLGESRTAGRR